MNCRSCDHALVEVLDLGEQRLADFRTDDVVPPSYPLRVMFCSRCYLAQLDTTVPRDLMYHERYGFKSGVNESIRADLKDIVEETLLRHPSAKSWLDIACNDGTLLSFVPKNIYRAGCDPVLKYAKEAISHADRIDNAFFDPRFYTRYDKKFDVVTSISMFYDVDDPNEFIEGVKRVLKEDGVWVIQQNYLGDMVNLNAFDNVCHEHLTYFSLLSLERLLSRHGLEVFDVQLPSVNGGCLRTFVAHKGTRKVHPGVKWQVKKELYESLNDISAFKEWTARVREELLHLIDYVVSANKHGKSVAIYGASTRGGTIWQSAGLTADDFCYAVERNPEKYGKTMSSIGLKIVSEEEMRADPPDYMVCAIWFFRDEVLKREKDYKGKWIFPLPEFEVVG